MSKGAHSFLTATAIAICGVLGFLLGWESQKSEDLERQLKGAQSLVEITREEFADYRNSRKAVDAKWSEMHKEATGRAAMWLAKLNEEKAKNKAENLRDKNGPIWGQRATVMDVAIHWDDDAGYYVEDKTGQRVWTESVEASGTEYRTIVRTQEAHEKDPRPGDIYQPREFADK